VSAAPAPKPAKSARLSIRAELDGLAAARAALASGEASRALAILDRGEAPWQLAAERTALRVRALCALGRVSDARAEARLGPAAADRVRATCSLDEDDER
jgi:hypothetical protein